MKILFKPVILLIRKIRSLRYQMMVKDLLSRGLRIGKNVNIAPTTMIDHDYCYLISIGDNCSLAKGVRLLAHDATTFKYVDGHTRIGKIDIKENCYFGEDVIVLPDITIGPKVLLAAGSVVNKDIPPNSCVAGIPARFYAKFDDFLARHRQGIQEREVFNYEDISNPSEETKNKVRDIVKDGFAYVKGFTGRFPWTWN